MWFLCVSAKSIVVYLSEDFLGQPYNVPMDSSQELMGFKIVPFRRGYDGHL